MNNSMSSRCSALNQLRLNKAANSRQDPVLLGTISRAKATQLFADC